MVYGFTMEMTSCDKEQIHCLTEDELHGLLSELAGRQEFVFLDTSRPDRENDQSFLFVDLVERLTCRAGEDAIAFLEQMQARLAEGFYLAGWLAYEFGAELEPKVAPQKASLSEKGRVVADFGVFLKPLTFDHLSGANRICQGDRGGGSSSANELGSYRLSEPLPNMSKQEFTAALDRVRAYIGAGDTYQVNYTMKLGFDFAGSPQQLYLDLRRNQSVAYGAYIRNHDEHILSFSPELFFRQKEGELTVRPMKGTAPRGRNLEEENTSRRWLHQDQKNRSENVMIVDLLRNDLARLVHSQGGGSVVAASMFDVESYESLLQMTSTIKARPFAAQANPSLVGLFRALFPCGSITGAPKIRTMQIIDELEKENRGVYTGAIGFLAPDSSCTFNVPIRTIRLKNGRGEMGIGAGITYDSVPLDEWDESLLKGRFLTHAQPAFTLFETLLWLETDGYWLLAEHLERLAAAASFYKFPFARNKAELVLARAAEGFGGAARRVRLRLSKDGQLELTSTEVRPPAQLQLPEPMASMGPLPTVSISHEPLDTSDSWVFHKTSRRAHYDRQLQLAQAAGQVERILINQDGEVTEGCISNLIIAKDGRFLTPALSCGLLAGTMRNYLLTKGHPRIDEVILYPEDVYSADAIFLCNSVRGVVQVQVQS